MKLIVSHLETLRTYVTREFYYVMTDLMSTHGWQHIEIYDLWNGAGSLKEKLLARFGQIPEIILFSEAYEFLHAHKTEISRLNSNKFFFADDLHWWNEEMKEKKLVSFALCDTILSTYQYTWDKFYPAFCGTKKVIWMPHSASPDFMLPYNPHAANSIFLSGAMTTHYPLRQQMKQLHSQGCYSIDYHCHPGYACGYDFNDNKAIGPGYAEMINKYRAAFTDSLIYRYVVAKYFEIPATGALLFADDAVSRPLRELGFIENEHYVPVSKENLEERIAYVLDDRNHQEINQIRQRGQRLVWNRHKTSDRAREINEICSSSSRT